MDLLTASTTRRLPTAVAKAAVVAASVLFGTSAVAVRLLAPDLPAMSTAGWRVVIGGGVLLTVCVLLGRAPWRYPRRWGTAVVGGAAFLAFQCGYFVAVDRVGVATATIVTIGTSPVVAGIIDRVRRGIRLRARWWVGVLLAAAGIALMSGAESVMPDPVGWACAVTAGACFPVFGGAIGDLMSDRPALTAIATVFGFAIPPAAVLLACVGTNPFADLGTAAAVSYVGFIATALAYALWARALTVLTLGDTVTLTMVEPIAATVFAVLILHEVAGPVTAAGVAVTLLGVGVATRRGRTAGGTG